MKNFISNLKKIYIFFEKHKSLKRLAIFLLLFLIPFAIFIIFVKKYAVGLGDDTSLLVFGNYYFQKHKFTWNHDCLGETSFLSSLIWYLSQFLLHKIFNSDVVANLSMLFIFQYYLPLAGMYYFLRKIFKLNIVYSILGSLFYVYNPFHLIIFFSPIYSPVLSFFPFTFAFYILALRQTLKKVSIKQQIFFIGMISILLSLAINGISHISYANVYLFAFVFYYLYTLIKIIKKRAYHKLIPLHLTIIGIIFLTILLNLYWLYNDIELFLGTLTNIQGGLLRTFDTSAMEYYDVIRLLGNWSFKSAAYYDYYHPYHYYFYTPLGLFLTYTLVVFIFLPIFFIKKNTKLVFYYIYLFFVLSIAAGVTSPLGAVFKYFYVHFNIFTILRSPDKVNLNIIFIYAILLAFALKLLIERTKNKTLKITFVSLLILSLLYTIWPSMAAYNLNKMRLNGSLASPYEKVPGYHYELKKDLENKILINRTLILPYYVYGTKQYWEKGSNQGWPAPYSLIDKPMLSIRNTDPPKEPLAGGSILKPEILKILNVKNIVLLRDIDSRYYQYYSKKDSATEYYDYHFFEKILDSENFIKEKDYFLFTPEYVNSLPNDARSPYEIYKGINNLKGKYAITLYQVKDENFLPIFYIPNRIVYTPPQKADIEESKDKRIIYIENVPDFIQQNLEKTSENNALIEYKEIFPYKYKIRISNITNSFPLIFSNHFHKFWKIYPTRFTENDKNNEYISPTFQNATQDNNIPSGKLLESMSLQALDEKYHFQVNGYANAWYLDLDYLQNSFPEFVQLNEDGSIDIELIIEFKKQNIIYICLGISLLILFLLITFIIYFKLNSRRQRFLKTIS